MDLNTIIIKLQTLSCQTELANLRDQYMFFFFNTIITLQPQIIQQHPYFWCIITATGWGRFSFHPLRHLNYLIFVAFSFRFWCYLVPFSVPSLFLWVAALFMFSFCALNPRTRMLEMRSWHPTVGKPGPILENIGKLYSLVGGRCLGILGEFVWYPPPFLTILQGPSSSGCERMRVEQNPGTIL